MVDLFKRTQVDDNFAQSGDVTPPPIAENTSTSVGGHFLCHRLRIQEPDGTIRDPEGTIRPRSILLGGDTRGGENRVRHERMVHFQGPGGQQYYEINKLSQDNSNITLASGNDKKAPAKDDESETSVQSVRINDGDDSDEVDDITPTPPPPPTPPPKPT